MSIKVGDEVGMSHGTVELMYEEEGKTFYVVKDNIGCRTVYEEKEIRKLAEEDDGAKPHPIQALGESALIFREALGDMGVIGDSRDFAIVLKVGDPERANQVCRAACHIGEQFPVEHQTNMATRQEEFTISGVPFVFAWDGR